MINNNYYSVIGPNWRNEWSSFEATPNPKAHPNISNLCGSPILVFYYWVLTMYLDVLIFFIIFSGLFPLNKANWVKQRNWIGINSFN